MSASVLRRLLLVPALLALLAVGAGCSGTVSPAVEVNGRKISDRELLDEVGEWVHSKAIPEGALADQSPGAYPQRLVGQIISQRVVLELNHQQFRKLGLRLTSDDLAQVPAAMSSSSVSGEELLASFGAEYRKEFTDLVAQALALQAEMGDGYTAWQNEAVNTADVKISPKFGTWDPAQGTVTAPSGPQRPDDQVGLPAA